ncbi:MAG TPA: alpha-hydroxy acid oxidase, partial [Bryobacteraceae bacterium]|nr:alpha-hydroxy acid oxidase [Bryobacteraceae bacterium]
MQVDVARRKFLRYLAASPLAAALNAADEYVITKPEEALSVFDFEAAARKALPPAHFGYLSTGVDDDYTLRANREGFRKFQIRPRRLVDTSKIDTRVTLFGTTYDSPIIIAPCGNQKAFHPDAEYATSRAAASRKTLQILSTATNTSIEDVTK